MSVSLTEAAVMARTKTVTRRLGWRFLKPGDRLTDGRIFIGDNPEAVLLAELARVDKQVAAAEKDIQRAEGKLRNEEFTANAPEAVVAKERAILEEARATLGKLQAQRAALEALGQ